MSLTFAFTTLNPPGSVFGTFAYGLNDFGRVVGAYNPSDGPAVGFQYSNGHYGSVGQGVFGNAIPTGLNNLGGIVGTYINAHGSSEIFSQQFGAASTIADPFPGTPGVSGINDVGAIVGANQYFAGNAVHTIGWVDQVGRFATVAAPRAVVTVPTGINDFGQITGYYQDAGGQTQGFVDTNGTFTTVDVPGAVMTEPASINNFGEVAGTSFTLGHSNVDGFVELGGQFATVDVPGARQGTEITALNDFGQIAGIYDDGNAFVATPSFDLSQIRHADLMLPNRPQFLHRPA